MEVEPKKSPDATGKQKVRSLTLDAPLDIRYKVFQALSSHGYKVHFQEYQDPRVDNVAIWSDRQHFVLNYRSSSAGTNHSISINLTHPRSIEELVSRLILEIDYHDKPERWSCREDCADLRHARHSAGHLKICHDASKWAEGFDLYQRVKNTARGRALDYVIRQAPIVLKPWRLTQERNYWNSVLNGGLPAIRKRTRSMKQLFLFMTCIISYSLTPLSMPIVNRTRPSM